MTIFPKKLENLGLNAWKKKKRRDRDHLPKDLSLQEVEKKDRRRILVKNKGLDREKRERDRDIWVSNEPGQTLSIYRSKHLNRSKRYQEVLRTKSR